MHMSFIVGQHGIQQFMLDGQPVDAPTALPVQDTKRAASQRLRLAMRAQGELNHARREFMAGRGSCDDLSILANVAKQRWRDVDDPKFVKLSPRMKMLFLEAIECPQEAGAR